MITKLRQIGNSRGVILPAPFLKALQVDQELDVRLEGDSIILKAPTSLREERFKGYLQADDSSVWEGVSLSSDEDWEW